MVGELLEFLVRLANRDSRSFHRVVHNQLASDASSVAHVADTASIGTDRIIPINNP